MKSLFTVLFALCFIMATAVQAADKKDKGFSAEGPFYDFYLGNDLRGYVRTKEDCKTCKEVTYRISPEVEAKLDGNIVPLRNFIMSGHQPSILHFDSKGKLRQIVWYSK